MKTSTRFLLAGLVAAVAVCAFSSTGMAQITYRVSTSNLYPAPPVAPIAQDDAVMLTDDQLDELLGPIALYPDSLLAQIFPAATYPMEIVVAAQWLTTHPRPSEVAIDIQTWDDSVKAMVHYPTVLQTMSDHAEWTQTLGVAFLNQPQDVMDSIQRLRRRAHDFGNLQSTTQVQVFDEDGMIMLLPADPQVVYVPTYDANIIYVRRRVDRPFTWDNGHPIGVWLDNDIDWDHHRVTVGGGWHQGWRFENRSWKRDAYPTTVIDVRGKPVYTRNLRVDNTIKPIVVRSWTRDDHKPRPKLPTALLMHPDSDPRDRGWQVDRERDRDYEKNPPLRGKPFELPVRDRNTPVSVRVNVTPPPASTNPLWKDYQDRFQTDRDTNRGYRSLTPSIKATFTPSVSVTVTPSATSSNWPHGSSSVIQVPSDADRTNDESKRGHSSMHH